MAGELHVNTTTAKTVYFMVWSFVGQIARTDGTTHTFEAYDTTHRAADYSIAATEQGTASGVYLGTMPSWIAAGDYIIEAYIRAGGSPAEGDVLCGYVERFHWSGSVVTPVGLAIPVVAAGAANGLTIAGSNAATTFAGLTTGALSCTTITASGAVAFQSTFAVTTSTSLAALSCTTLTASGAVAFQSTFAVTGTTTLTGNVSLGGSLGVTGVTTLGGLTTGALSCTTITASGAVAFQSTFAVTTSTSLAALSCTTLTASGAVAFQSTFAVTGTTTLTGNVSLGGTLGVTGTTTLNALTVTNGLLVSGTTTLTGAVTASNGANSITGITVSTNSDKTGYSLTVTPPTAAQIATAVWTDTTAGDFTTSTSPGKIIFTQLGGAFTSASSSVFTALSLANAPTGTLTAAQVATAVWQDTTSGDFTTVGSPGYLLTSVGGSGVKFTTTALANGPGGGGSSPTAIWEDLLAGGDFDTPGSIGNLLKTAIPNAAPGVNGGLMVSGSNSATTFATLTVTGAFLVSGGATYTNAGGDGFLCTSSGSNGNGINAHGNGSGHGISTLGGTGGEGVSVTGQGGLAGMQINGGSTGPALQLVGGGTSGSGIVISTTVGNGILISPTGGHGIWAIGNGTDKHGLFATGGTGGTSDGIKAVAGTGGVDIRGNITGNVTGNLSGSVNSVTTGVTVTTNNDKTGYALTSAYDFAKGTVQMTETYAALHAVPTPIQSLLWTQQFLTENGYAGTVGTVKKIDGATTAGTTAINSATTPTGITRFS